MAAAQRFEQMFKTILCLAATGDSLLKVPRRPDFTDATVHFFRARPAITTASSSVLGVGRKGREREGGGGGGR